MPAIEDKSLALVRLYIFCRWALLGVLLVIALLVLMTQGEFFAFSGLGLLAVVLIGIFYNFLVSCYFFIVRARSLAVTERLQYLQIIVDVLLVTALLYITGGVQSSEYWYYLFPLIFASAFFSVRDIVVTIFGVMTMYFAVAGAELNGLIPHIERFVNEPAMTSFATLQSSTAGRLLTYLPFLVLLFIVMPFLNRLLWMARTNQNTLYFEKNFLSFVIEKINFGLMVFDSATKIVLVNNFAKSQLEGSRLLRETISADVKKTGSVTSINRDVRDTETKRAYRVAYSQLRLQDESHSIVVIEDVTGDQEISEMKSQFISIAAHQLRTPLAAIKWVVSFLLQGDVGKISDEQRDLLEKAYMSNERMIKLVDDLLNVSRIEERRISYNFEKERLEGVLDEMVKTYTMRARAKNITFEYDRDIAHSFEQWLDVEKIKLVFDNLLDNAFKYSPSGSKVILRLRYSEDNAKVWVIDNGIGVPRHELGRLFTKFFRAENVIKYETEGTGLGLFIVKNIVESHKGQVICTSDEGKGTTFELTFYKDFKPEKKLFKM